MTHKVGVPVVAQVRRFLALSIKEHTDIKRDYRTRDSKRDEHAESCTKSQRRIYASVYYDSCKFIHAMNMLQRAINYRLRHKDMSRYADKITQDKWCAELTRILLRSLLSDDIIEQFINYMEGRNTK
jgi:hypothetical protein